MTTYSSFCHERRCQDMKWAEIITGLLSLSYGLQAIMPGTSQFKVLLSVQGNSFVWGGTLMVAGVLSVLFAYSVMHVARFSIGLVLFAAWAAVVVLFAQSEVPGPPLFNGMILMAVAVRVMVGAARHEKQHRTGL